MAITRKVKLSTKTSNSKKDKDMTVTAKAKVKIKPASPSTMKADSKAKAKTVKKDLVRIMEAIHAKLDAVTPEVLIAAINAAGSSKKVKEPKIKEPKVKSSGEQFVKVTKDFGYRLKQGKIPTADMKEKFKSALDKAKITFPSLRVSCFNKIVNSNKQEGIVAGLRKSKGEWIFVCYDANGKKFNCPVSNIVK